MAEEKSDKEDKKFMCYSCNFTAGNPDNILVHTVEIHEKVGTFSLRKRMFDENFGLFAFKSIHFSISIERLTSYLKDGHIIQIDCDKKKISCKRRAPTEIEETSQHSKTDASSQTCDSELYEILPSVVEVLKDMGRYDDFISLLHCIRDGTITENIALHLILDVGGFYSKDCVSTVRYNDVSVEFWMTVQKLFKAKGVNFFRGYKAQGLATEDHPAGLSPRDCRINFAVPSKQTLSKHFTEYNMDAGSPGLLNIPLYAFANINRGKDVKLSIDGKKVAIGLGELGDENLAGHEMPPTLNERKDRLATEVGNLQHLSSLLKDEISCGVDDFTEIDKNSKMNMKQCLLMSISHMSKRIKELREFEVKRRLHVQKLMKMIDGDWRQSKLAAAISYWQTKLVLAQSHIGELLEAIDKFGYAVACINGTSDNYILGIKGTVFLQHQANYICLKETIPTIELGYEDCAITKQRTEKWMQFRKESKVTGSTLYRALGLGTLREQQEHYDRVYRNIEKPISERIQSFLDHGTKEEINALGTLVGKILPVYFPNLLFREDGCEIIDVGDSKAVISGDGTGVSTEDVPVVAFEFKCPIPGKTYTTDLQYKIPPHYITQIVSQMAVKKCESLAFISYTHESASYIQADMNMDLWRKIRNFAEELYGTDNPPRPTRKNPNSKSLLDDLLEYSDTCSFMAEFPSLKAVDCSCEAVDDKKDVYGRHGKECIVRHDPLSINEVFSTVEASTRGIQQAYELLRRAAKEVLVTVISDLERHASESVSHAVPIHYGLSGFSLNMKTVRNILEEILLTVYEKELNVRAIAFDGQFLELSVEGNDGKALTICRLMKQHWESVKKIDKKTKMQYLLEMNKFPKIGTMDDLISVFGIVRNANNGIILKSKTPIKHLGSPENVTAAILKSKKKPTDRMEQTDTIIPSAESQQDLIFDNVDDLENAIQEIDQIEEMTDNVLGNSQIITENTESIEQIENDVYEEALVSLIALSGEEHFKWTGLEINEFKEIFKDPKEIKKRFTVNELRYLVSISKDEQKGLNAKKKTDLVNLISELFGDGSKLEVSASSPKSLKEIASNSIKSWPVDAINVAYSQLTFPSVLDNWNSDNPFKGEWTIMTETGRMFVIPQWYAQPATFQNNLFQPIIDPHHIFVNNRCMCCSKGMSGMGVSPEAWWEVAKCSRHNGTGLSIEIAKDLRDRQSNSYAQTTFSKPVQLEMEKNGRQIESKWCQLIRNWYSAVDEAGIEVEKRIEHLMQMRSHLLAYFQVGHFPPVGAYVAGMPIAQFEGIMCNVDRRLQLYVLAKEKTYNQRAISSLDSETFFSGFQDYDPKGTGVLRADDIPIALGSALFLYKQRLDPSRKFFMKTSQKARVYPVNPLMQSDESVADSKDDTATDSFISRVVMLRSHLFDSQQRKSKNPKRKSGTISNFGKSARGAEGVRAHHKSNEEKILSHRRYGLNDDELFS